MNIPSSECRLTQAERGRRKRFCREIIQQIKRQERLGMRHYIRKSGIVFNMQWAKGGYDCLTHHYREHRRWERYYTRKSGIAK